MRIVVLGLSITSSWGNGHATTYRSLLKGLHERGHNLLFLERDKPWYLENRDLPDVPYASIALYEDIDSLASNYATAVRDADLVIVGSYVPDGVLVGDWVLKTARGVTAFYDIDTPVTLAKLERGDEEYLAKCQIPDYDLYFSFTGGLTLRRIEEEFGAKAARALYCSVDTDLYFPEPQEHCWQMGYLGTFSEDRQPALDRLLIRPASQMKGSRFVVAGPLYPDGIVWPENVERIQHLAPPDHRSFYNSQRFTLNITRADMQASGYSPSVRLFEAAACATPIISDTWAGLEEFFTPGLEILVASSAEEVIRLLALSEAQSASIGTNGRNRILRDHTASHRARQVEQYVQERCTFDLIAR